MEEHGSDTQGVAEAPRRIIGVSFTCLSIAIFEPGYQAGPSASMASYSDHGTVLAHMSEQPTEEEQEPAVLAQLPERPTEEEHEPEQEPAVLAPMPEDSAGTHARRQCSHLCQCRHPVLAPTPETISALALQRAMEALRRLNCVGRMTPMDYVRVFGVPDETINAAWGDQVWYGMRQLLHMRMQQWGGRQGKSPYTGANLKLAFFQVPTSPFSRDAAKLAYDPFNPLGPDAAQLRYSFPAVVEPDEGDFYKVWCEAILIGGSRYWLTHVSRLQIVDGNSRFIMYRFLEAA